MLNADSNGNITNVKADLKTRNGDIKHVLLSAENIYVQDKKYRFTVVHDITELKHAEDEISRQAGMITSLLDSIPDIIFFKDQKGVYLGCNPPFAEFVGQARGEIVGKTDYDLFDKEIADFFRKHDISMLNVLKSQQNEEWITYPDGRKILIDTLKTPYWGPDGTLIGLLGISRDITERKQAEKELRKLSVAVTQSPVSIVITDVDGNIEFVNPKFEDVTGYDLNEALGTKPSILKSGEQPDSYYQTLWTTISSGKTWRGEFHNKKKNGELYWESASISPILDDSGNITQYIAVKEDITDRKQAEQENIALEAQLHQAQKLEAIGTMVGGISHEFNNVLQSMFLYASLVQADLPKNEVLRSNFQHILDDGNRAKDLIKQVLTFSRKTKVEMKPQPLHEMVMEVLVFERALLPATIEIIQDIDMNCGLVQCDKTQISQIIMNLCSNAQHAMEEKGGTLTVSLKPTRASQNKNAPETDVLELTVSDTGHGIDAPDLERIFDPFFTTKQFGKGTGLGLSVIHGIVEMMDGHISVTSKLGKGTTFRILFPVTDVVLEEKVVKLAGQADVMSQVILLVDDEESIRAVTQIILTRKGFKVDSASDGKQALELFKANPGKYGLIVTDQSMPKMSGVELTKAIRSTNADIPIILSTGQLGVADEKEFKDIGITTFIQKPWTAEELLERIQELGN